MINELRIIGCESLGVRGLSLTASLKGSTKILIDPGVALGYTRYGLHPHPIQAVAGDVVRRELISYWGRVSDVVISHLHGDHTPLPNANPFQLSLNSVGGKGFNARIWVPSSKLLRGREALRLKALRKAFKELIKEVEGGEGFSNVSFHGPIPHGGVGTPVILTLIELNGLKLLHAPGSQLVSGRAVELIIKLRPEAVVTDGPPIYRFMHNQLILNEVLDKALKNLRRIAEVVNTVVIDHHILRCVEGYEWVLRVRREVGRLDCTVLTAAEAELKPPTLLEAWRRVLYREAPVSNEWFMNHSSYSELVRRYYSTYFRFVEELRRVKSVREDQVSEALRRALKSINGLIS